MITDLGVKRLSNLRSLNLYYNERITDLGVKKLSNLSKLNLEYNNMITDSGIKGLKNLKEIYLCESKITMKMENELRMNGVKVLNY